MGKRTFVLYLDLPFVHTWKASIVHYYLFNPPFQKKSEGTSLYVYTWYRCSLKQYNAAPGRASLANLKSLVLNRIILLLPLWMNWFLSVTSTNHLLDFDEEK